MKQILRKIRNRRRFLAYIYCKRGKSRNEDETGIWFCAVFCGTWYGDHDVYSEHIYRNSDRSAVPPCRISAFLLLILKKYKNCRGNPKKALRMQGFYDTMLTLQKNTCVVYPGGAKADKHGSRT